MRSYVGEIGWGPACLVDFIPEVPGVLAVRALCMYVLGLGYGSGGQLP
jgi:hypothetical protein